MPRQFFRIDRAPEAKPIMAREIELLLYKNRRDTEWGVSEIDALQQLNAADAKKRCCCDFVFWFCEKFGERYLKKDYLGNGNFSEERGWLLFGRFVSAEWPPNKSIRR